MVQRWEDAFSSAHIWLRKVNMVGVEDGQPGGGPGDPKLPRTLRQKKKSIKTLISCLKILGSFGEEGWKEEMMGSVFMCSISMGHRLGGDKGQQKNQKPLQG